MNVDSRDYMSGMCHVFAIAARRVTGWTMMAAMSGKGAKGERFRNYGDVVHVFVVDDDDNRVDAFGQGEEFDEYACVKGRELGRSIGLIEIDEGGIAELVRMGWLREFDEVDIAKAMEDAREVLENEGYDPEDQPIGPLR